MSPWITCFFYHIKQMFSMLSWVCLLIDDRSCKKVVRTSVVHPDVPCVPLFCSNHITDITCDLFMNRRTAVKLILRCSNLVPIRCQTKNIRKGKEEGKGRWFRSSENHSCHGQINIQIPWCHWSAQKHDRWH